MQTVSLFSPAQQQMLVVEVKTEVFCRPIYLLYLFGLGFPLCLTLIRNRAQ